MYYCKQELQIQKMQKQKKNEAKYKMKQIPEGGGGTLKAAFLPAEKIVGKAGMAHGEYR